VRQGLVKKRSIAFDERYGIHHLAFLGYNCPAVPGMENIYSDAGRIITIESEFENTSMLNTGKEAGAFHTAFCETNTIGRIITGFSETGQERKHFDTTRYV